MSYSTAVKRPENELSEHVMIRLTPLLKNGMKAKAIELGMSGPDAYRLACALFIQNGVSYGHQQNGGGDEKQATT